jgi:hypothetical protein
MGEPPLPRGADVAQLEAAARKVAETSLGMRFASATLLERRLTELRDAVAGGLGTKAGVNAVVAAARRVVDGASTDHLLKSGRGGAAFVTALRGLRQILREFEARAKP